jgi:hypothetical protein
MKKWNLLTLIIIVMIIFSACNNNEKKTEVVPASLKTDTITSLMADSTECDDYYITQNEGEFMIKKFNDIYPRLAGTIGHQLIPQFWIDSCEISSIVAFFNTPNGKLCDGVRFCSIEKGHSGLVIVPTSAVVPSSETFRHTNRWDLPITNLCKVPTTARYINIPNAQAMMVKFDETFRGEKSEELLDSLSSSVWMRKCVIEKIYATINDKSKKLNGLMALCAAHFRKEARADRLGQKYANQSTFIFVPTEGNEHKLVWKVVNPPANFDKEKYRIKDGAFNHGELCPQICN